MIFCMKNVPFTLLRVRLRILRSRRLKNEQAWGADRCQEISKPGTTISHASNLCTAVGGDQNKEFRDNASFLREKGPRGGIKIYCYCIFHIDQKAKTQMYSL